MKLGTLLFTALALHLAGKQAGAMQGVHGWAREQLGDLVPAAVPTDAPVWRGHFVYDGDGPSFYPCGRAGVRLWAVGAPLFRVVSAADRYRVGFRRVAYVELRGVAGEIRDPIANALDVDGVQYGGQLDAGALLLSREPSPTDCQ